MAAPIAAMMGMALVSLALVAAPTPESDKTSSPKSAQASKATGDGGEWKFTSGRRSKRKRGSSRKAPLPSKSLQRPPIAPAGGYQGLRLESKAQPPVAVVPDPKGAPVLTWVGFQRDPTNHGVVFVQVDQKVKPSTKQKKGRFELFLPGVKVTQANHARTLDLRYFPQTAAKYVRTKVTSKGTRITVGLRGAAKPVMTTRPGPEGQFQVLINVE